MKAGEVGGTWNKQSCTAVTENCRIRLSADCINVLCQYQSYVAKTKASCSAFHRRHNKTTCTLEGGEIRSDETYNWGRDIKWAGLSRVDKREGDKLSFSVSLSDNQFMSPCSKTSISFQSPKASFLLIQGLLTPLDFMTHNKFIPMLSQCWGPLRIIPFDFLSYLCFLFTNPAHLTKKKKRNKLFLKACFRSFGM